MEKNSMSFSVHENSYLTSTSFDAFISFMRNSNDFWYIKDHESRFIFMNDCARHYTGLPKEFKLEGKLDSECPAYWSDIADVIQANDKRVMDSQRTVPTLFTLMYGGKENLMQSFMADVSPLIKDGKSIGIVGRAKKLEIYSMYHLANKRNCDTIAFGNPTPLFTNREFDVVFYAIQSLSTKEIARRLDISPNTVKKYLQSVYEKIDVSALSQLIEYCRARGYDNYAPNRFISTEPYVPLVDVNRKA